MLGHINQGLKDKLSEANLALAHLNALMDVLPQADVFISMYQKKEALLSAQIDGVQTSLVDVLKFEQGVKVKKMRTVREIVNSVKALHYGVEQLKIDSIDMVFINSLNAIMLQDTRWHFRTCRRTKYRAGMRPLSNIIEFIRPNSENLSLAILQLEYYLDQSLPYPELINCALMFYQLEAIHSFFGYKRVGRLFITLYLYWKGVIEKPLLYPSYFFKKNRQEYYDRLMMVRNTGNYEQWASFFLKGITESSQAAIDETKQILKLQQNHQKLLWEKKISSPAATVLLNYLFDKPIVSIVEIERHFKISYPTASHLVNQFVAIGILYEITGQKRSKRFVYRDYMTILSEGAQPL